MERKSYKKMTRTMRMGEDIIATKFGSWKIEGEGATDLVYPRKLNLTPIIGKAEQQLYLHCDHSKDSRILFISYF